MGAMDDVTPCKIAWKSADWMQKEGSGGGATATVEGSAGTRLVGGASEPLGRDGVVAGLRSGVDDGLTVMLERGRRWTDGHVGDVLAGEKNSWGGKREGQEPSGDV